LYVTGPYEALADPTKGIKFSGHLFLSILYIAICSAPDEHLLQVKLNSQYYFYMETQAALAIPDEDNCMVVYSSSQCPETAQNVIAKCLGLPCHNVRVITRRVGGGFGGKAVRSLPVSVRP
jgi:xanthine dehydrogenase molybdopterin-binding subunit B